MAKAAIPQDDRRAPAAITGSVAFSDGAGGGGSVPAFIVPDTREAIELAVEALIGRLDEMDGDPDLEPNGDELDVGWCNGTVGKLDTGHEDDEEGYRSAPHLLSEDYELSGDERDSGNAEDEELFAVAGAGPGCIVSDPDFCAARDDHGTAEGGVYDGAAGDADDAEDEDSDTGGDEGEPDFTSRWKRLANGPGCTISDPDYGNEDGVEAIMETLPRYGLDQTRGPINERGAR
jgi:hypothetical protein